MPKNNKITNHFCHDKIIIQGFFDLLLCTWINFMINNNFNEFHYDKT